MRTRERKNNDVMLASIHHKINRKAAIDRDIAWGLFNDADMSVIEKLEDSFLETIKTPVGKAVSRYWDL